MEDSSKQQQQQQPPPVFMVLQYLRFTSSGAPSSTNRFAMALNASDLPPPSGEAMV